MTKTTAIILLILIGILDVLLIVACGELEKRNGYKAKEDADRMEHEEGRQRR